MSVNTSFTVEGPRYDECRIIGVELAARNAPDREFELEMFQCKHTIPPPPYYGENTEVRVTLHTSKGDVTLRGYLPR